MKRKDNPDPYALTEAVDDALSPPPQTAPGKPLKPSLDLDPAIKAKEPRSPIDPPAAVPPRPESPAAESPRPEKPPAESARFTDTMQAGIHVITLSRRDVVDAEYIKQVGDDIYRHLKPHPTPKVVIDLTPVAFMSSAAIGMLIALRSVVVDKMDGKICIANVSNDLKQVFKITKMHKLMKIHNDTDKAIKSML